MKFRFVFNMNKNKQNYLNYDGLARYLAPLILLIHILILFTEYGIFYVSFNRMFLKARTGNGERGTGNGSLGTSGPRFLIKISKWRTEKLLCERCEVRK